MDTIYLFVILALAIGISWIWRKAIELEREKFIRTYMFPKGLLSKLGTQRSGIGIKEQQLVARGLRQFFLAHLKSGRKFVSMPSQIADDLWHEFILYTRDYEKFCSRAFGKFLHHTPAVALSADKQNNTGLRRVWRHACLEDNINPLTPTRLPLLFALDEKLKVEGGFRYTTDCSGFKREGEKKDAGGGTAGGSPYCGGDFSSTSFDGSTDGLSSDSDGGGGDGGDGGGCGGGCGGGD